MIKDFHTENVPEWDKKKNWIDDRGIVFGYEIGQQCCEEIGWGVYDKQTKELVCTSPEGLAYHFDYENGPRDVEDEADSYRGEKNDSNLECVQIDLIPDDDAPENPVYVFEAFCDHNGYYAHDYSICKVDVEQIRASGLLKRNPRMFLIRGLPGTGKSTMAKEYDCIHIEEDMFAIKGGVYHWNSQDGSEWHALDSLMQAISLLTSKKKDFVLSSVMPYITDQPEDQKGYLLYHALKEAFLNGYDVYMTTLTDIRENVHECPSSVYSDTFMSQTRLIDLMRCYGFYGMKFEIMPREIVVCNTRVNQ